MTKIEWQKQLLVIGFVLQKQLLVIGFVLQKQYNKNTYVKV